MPADDPYQSPRTRRLEDGPAPLRRGPGLLLFLVFVSLAACVTPLLLLSSWPSVVEAYPRWFAWSLVAIAVLRAVAVAGLWWWSREAVLLFAALSFATPGMLLAVGMPVRFTDFIGIVLLGLVMRSYWPRMPWRLAGLLGRPPAASA